MVSFVINETSSSGCSCRCRFRPLLKAFRRRRMTLSAEIWAWSDAASASASPLCMGGGPIILLGQPGAATAAVGLGAKLVAVCPDRYGGPHGSGLDAYHSGGAVRVRRAAEMTPARAPGPILAQRRAAKDPATFQGTAPRSRMGGCGGVPRAGEGSSKGRGAGLGLLALKTCSAASAAVSHRRFLGLEPGGCPARRGRTASIHTSDSSDARAVRAERRALHTHSAHPSTRDAPAAARTGRARRRRRAI